MSGLRSFLQRLVDVLEGAGVDYMVTGSMASALHGTPRSTQDLDVVIQLDASALRALLSRLDSSVYYVNEDAARGALRHQTQFNVVDMASGWKVDLIVKKDRPFSESEFGRRTRAVILGVDLWVATAEDVILSKLEWSKKSGGSQRQLDDVAGIVEARDADLDREYIDQWCRDLGILDIWKAVAG